MLNRDKLVNLNDVDFRKKPCMGTDESEVIFLYAISQYTGNTNYQGLGLILWSSVKDFHLRWKINTFAIFEHKNYLKGIRKTTNLELITTGT